MRRFLSHKRKFLPLFIGLLIIGVLIGIMIPTIGSAEPAGDMITGFFCRNKQENISYDKAALRFAFSVESKNYDCGVVYSNTNDFPLVGESDCTVEEAWKIHSSTNTNLDGHYSGSGRYWAEIKIGNIWHTHYDDTYYVRAYVRESADSNVYYYSDEIICTSVNETFEHKHTVPSPTSTTTGTSLLDPGTRVGTCSVCHRNNVIEYVTPTVTSAHFTNSSSGTYVKKANIYSSLLHGARHFYPHSSNDNEGNDLLIEFSFLWNPSLTNLKNAYMEIARIANSNGGDGVTAFYLNFADNVSGMWVPYAGGFEGGEYNHIAFGPEGVYKQNPARNECVFIGEYGWHRIGVRIHEDAWIENGSPRYRITSTLYVDGRAVSSLDKTYNSSNNNLLYTASVVNGQLQYTDIADGRTLYGFRLGNKQTKSGKTTDFYYADYSISCGQTFVQDVQPVLSAIDRLPSDYPADVYYKEDQRQYYMINTAPQLDELGSISYYTPTLDHMYNESLSWFDYQEIVDEAYASVSTFEDSDFGSNMNIVQMPQKNTPVKPTTNETVVPTNQHPRLLFTADQLGDIRDTLFAPENEAQFHFLLIYANRDTDFSLGSDSSQQDHTTVEKVLQTIEAKAFLYQVTGSKTYGIQAVEMMKQFLKKIGTVTGGDETRTYGLGIFTAGLVYDWCYDLISDGTSTITNDQKQLIRGVKNKLCENMEVGFPPMESTPQYAGTGHGAERQVLRDYLAFSIAIYDEVPSWYNYVGWRIFDQFVPIRNEYYKSFYSPQGISTYLPIRFGSDLWSAWLIKTATGIFPYDSQTNMVAVMRSAYAHVTNGAKDVFEEGDDEGRSGKEQLRRLALCSMISGYIFNDPIAMSWAEYSDYAYINATYYIIMKSSGVEADWETRYYGMPLILYNGGYLGQFIVHSSWEETSASVLMKIGERTTGNHDHDDAGSFQIYYKGPLAVDSGFYDKYGSDHWSLYHQRTIAHNSIVLYRHNGDTTTLLQQRETGEFTSNNVNDWLNNDDFKTGEIKGHEFKYTDSYLNHPKYAYIAGDISAAYESSAYVTRLDRRMLAVYDTNNPSVPLYFFVYDYIVAQNNYDEKTFLLHVKEAPVVSSDKHSAYVDSGKGGRLVWQCVLCGDNDNYAIDNTNGGKVPNLPKNNRNFLINEEQIHAGKKNDDGEFTVYYTDDYWGRLELKPDSNARNKHQQMLNVFFVCDTSSGMTASSLPAQRFASSKIQGVAIGNTAAVFVTQEQPINQSFGFYTTGVSTTSLNYYVSNVAPGNWRVTTGNQAPQIVTATEEGKFIDFSGSNGTVILEYLGTN